MKHQVCTLSELQAKQKLRVMIGEKPLLVTVDQGVVYAIYDKCPHKGAPLSNGTYDDGVIQCKEHGLKIDVRTGMVVPSLKASLLVPNKDAQSVRMLKTMVLDGQVFIEL